MNRILLLFTQSHPYLKSAEDTFLKDELNYLNKHFTEIVVIPKSVGGKKALLPENILIDESFAEYFANKKLIFFRLLNGTDFRLIMGEIINNPNLVFNLKRLVKLLLYIDEMKRIRKWYKDSKYYKSNFVLFYTYWFTSITSSLALFVKSRKVITRIHGIDLYEGRHNGYIPLREKSLRNVHTVFCVSAAGIKYLRSKYPQYSRKYKLNRIGVKSSNKNFIVEKSDKSIFRIVSCSSIIPLKRVHLILKSVVLFASNNRATNVEYIHFGGGLLFEDLVKIKNSHFYSNLIVFFKGNIDNRDILNYYRDNYIDVFINSSSTEGIPVSMMEAQSYGIPCIGPKVGGIPEIIKNNNGILLSENPEPREIAIALDKINKMKENEIAVLRKNSFLNWNANFNAEINFLKFTEEISKI